MLDIPNLKEVGVAIEKCVTERNITEVVVGVANRRPAVVLDAKSQGTTDEEGLAFLTLTQMVSRSLGLFKAQDHDHPLVDALRPGC